MRRVVVVLGAVLLAACSRQAEEPARKPPADVPVWVVFAHRVPGVSAMTEAQAFNQHGHIVELHADRAISFPDTCARPEYRETHARADSLLALDYRIRATDLGLAPDAQLRVFDVVCDGALWPVMGGRIFWDAPDHGFAVWDGVFFELRPRGSR